MRPSLFVTRLADPALELRARGHADRTFAVRRVRVGARTAATVEIQSGLREGEEVVADGSLTLKAELERSSFADEDD